MTHPVGIDHLGIQHDRVADRVGGEDRPPLPQSQGEDVIAIRRLELRLEAQYGIVHMTIAERWKRTKAERAHRRAVHRHAIRASPFGIDGIMGRKVPESSQGSNPRQFRIPDRADEPRAAHRVWLSRSPILRGHPEYHARLRPRPARSGRGRRTLPRRHLDAGGPHDASQPRRHQPRASEPSSSVKSGWVVQAAAARSSSMSVRLLARLPPGAVGHQPEFQGQDDRQRGVEDQDRGDEERGQADHPGQRPPVDVPGRKSLRLREHRGAPGLALEQALDPGRDADRIAAGHDDEGERRDARQDDPADRQDEGTPGHGQVDEPSRTRSHPRPGTRRRSASSGESRRHSRTEAPPSQATAVRTVHPARSPSDRRPTLRGPPGSPPGWPRRRGRRDRPGRTGPDRIPGGRSRIPGRSRPDSASKRTTAASTRARQNASWPGRNSRGSWISTTPDRSQQPTQGPAASRASVGPAFRRLAARPSRGDGHRDDRRKPRPGASMDSIVRRSRAPASPDRVERHGPAPVWT